MAKTVGVFFGGRSNEREISVITGMLAVNLLRGAGYAVVPVYLPPEGGMATGKMQSPADFRDGGRKFTPVRLEGTALLGRRGRKVAVLDCALNCCHGGMGEDGTLAALLRWNGVRSASPDTAVSAVFMDKSLSKIAARGLGIPVARGSSVRETAWKGDRDAVLAEAERFGYPVVVKPCRLGSSIGVKVARDAAELADALALAFRLDDAALVEEYIGGRRDINCAACRIGGEIVLSPLEEVFSEGDILSFREKYVSAPAVRSEMPARLPPALAEEIGRCTRLVYESFGCRGVVRADFFVADGKAVFNELNTVPGSLACYLFGARLTENRAFLVSLVEEALAAPAEQKELVVSGILDEPVFSGAKSCKRRGNMV